MTPMPRLDWVAQTTVESEGLPFYVCFFFFFNAFELLIKFCGQCFNRPSFLFLTWTELSVCISLNRSVESEPSSKVSINVDIINQSYIQC